MDSEDRLLRPRPRKPFDLTPSAGSSKPPSPPNLPESPNPDTASAKEQDDLSPESRNQSVFNLTSPALLGIFSPTTLDNPRDDQPTGTTPWGTGAQTPSLRVNGTIPEERKPEVEAAKVAAAFRSLNERPHIHRKHGLRGFVLPFLGRSMLLFFFGMAYGVIITHLHSNPRMTPITLEGLVDSTWWRYLVFWGVAGVGLGSLMPWFDGVWEDAFGGAGGSTFESSQGKPRDAPGAPSARSRLAADWNLMVRSIGAFVGVAFAIRKLPWQSTLQVSLTLSLANPVLWYLLDRSKPGFIFSTVAGLIGMLVLLCVNPDIVPSPAITTSSPIASSMPVQISSIPLSDIWHNGISHESIALGIWIASVLFCSCVCFGNIGRRLASRTS